MALGPDSTLWLAGKGEDKFGRTDFLLYNISSEGRVILENRFGGPADDELTAVALTKYNEVIVGGITSSNLPHPENGAPDQHADGFVAKLDAAGSLQWQHSQGGSEKDGIQGVTGTSFGGVVAVGASWSRNHDLQDKQEAPLNNLWLLMYNREGELIRNKTFGGNKNDWGMDVAATSDGGFLTLGVTNSEDLDFAKARHNGDVWVQKLSFSGSKQWSQILKAPYEDLAYRIVPNPYDLFFIVGSRVEKEGGKQFWAAKLDSKGKVIFQKTWGGPGFEELRSAAVTSDGGLIVVGYAFNEKLYSPLDKGRADVWVMRLDSEGRMEWENTFGGPGDEIGVDVVEYQPGEYYVLAQKENTFREDKKNYGPDFWLLKLREQDCGDLKLDIITDISNYREKAGTPIKFINRSRFGDKWTWDFGDGTTSNDRSPVHTYRARGVYTVQLQAEVYGGCKIKYYYPQPVIITN